MKLRNMGITFLLAFLLAFQSVPAFSAETVDTGASEPVIVEQVKNEGTSGADVEEPPSTVTEDSAGDPNFTVDEPMVETPANEVSDPASDSLKADQSKVTR